MVTYTVDNAGPVVTASISPAPNAHGWNNSDVTVGWQATDAIAGVNSATLPTSQTITTNTAGLLVTATVADKLNNIGNGAATIKLDKTAPAIHFAQSPLPNAAGWNNNDVTIEFTCEDAPAEGSGIASCPGTTTLTETTSAGAWVNGIATDVADNSASVNAGPIRIDKENPLLAGAPIESPNAAGWYTADVTIEWTCSDALSGISGNCPANSVISSEGIDLADVASVNDNAGNTTPASSAPLVKIDKTPPNTTASAGSAWLGNQVIAQLNASDNQSGVVATYFTLDDGEAQAGTIVSIENEGEHTLRFWSVDNAGNVETTRTVQIKLDLSAPAIHHTISPLPNSNGWNNSDVTVTFDCSDALSGVTSCAGSQTVLNDGKDTLVKGTAIDNAGNTADDDVLISLDKTAPQITATLNSLPNIKGWHNTPVTILFECNDELSGMVDCSASQTLNAGEDQTIEGCATDAAGNSAGATITHINIDTQAPSLNGTLTSTPNAQGWHNDDAVVAWSCSDDMSGIEGDCPANSVVTGEGDDLSASASIQDNAGNETHTTFTSIKIDRATPATQASVPLPFAQGWHADAVLMTLNALDNLSGVAATYYKIDDGETQLYAGTFMFNLAGEHTLTFWSADNAGNVEDTSQPGHTLMLKIDAGAPAITGTRMPLPNAKGWNNTPVGVSFECSDAESGIASCTDSAIVSGEGGGQSVIGMAQDNAGHTSPFTISAINIDLTPPAITGAILTPAATDGWHIAPVTVHFICNDVLSGIATCPDDVVLNTNGAGQSVEGVAIDNTGNTSTFTVSGININIAPASIQVNGIADGSMYVLGAVPAASCAALAGGVEVAACHLAITGGTPSGVGTFNYTATAQLDAGTLLQKTGSYRVIYRFDGFMQPINDTTRSICAGCSESIFKGGSTVPVKFQLKRADGTTVAASQSPMWLTPVKGSAVIASVDEGVYSDAASSGLAYRWDAASQQFIYNWSTRGVSAGYRYRIGVTLDDGQTYFVTLGLR